jgi:hypothetical protein
MKESERIKADALYSVERLENKIKLAQQQGRLFEKEVKSLRALLQSFDAEFKIGKPTAETLIASKDKIVDDLRSQLDELRECYKASMDRTAELEEKEKLPIVESSVKPSSEIDVAMQVQREEIMQLRHQLQRLKDELLGLQQVTGMDFVPGRTRVLHLVSNPTASLTQGGGNQKFSNTLEELRYLREENKRLQALDDMISEEGETQLNNLDTMLKELKMKQ